MACGANQQNGRRFTWQRDETKIIYGGNGLINPVSNERGGEIKENE